MKTPNPGSDEAVAQGCICARMDNEYGDFELTGGYWAVRLDCPIHSNSDITASQPAINSPLTQVPIDPKDAEWTTRKKALQALLALPEMQDEVVEITDETWSEFAKTAPHPYNELRASIREAISALIGDDDA